MSCHVIYYKDGAKMMRPVLSEAEYRNIRNSDFQRTMVEAIRKGDEGLKHKLVQMNYSCLPNEDGTLRGATRVSDTVGMDVDWTPSLLPLEGEERIAASKAEWLKKVPELVLSKKEELGLLMLERSATKGFHLVFRRRPGLSQEENLRWASRVLGVEYDKGAKDITRVFFTTTNDELIYLSPLLFETTNFTNFTNSCVQADLKSDCEGGGDFKSPIKDARIANPREHEGNPREQALRTSLEAFDLCAKQAGLDVEAMDVWGVHNWHTNLMAVMSVGVGKLMSREQLMAVVAERLPNYSQTEDCQKLIDYFYEKYNTDKGFMNANLREINAKAQRKIQNSKFIIQNEAGADDTVSLPKREGLRVRLLPIGLRESLIGVPKEMQMPVLCSVLPLAAAYADGVEVEYCDGQRQHLGLMSIIRGEQASGKSVCKAAVDVWKRQFDEEDRQARQREEEWKERKKGRKANEKAPEDPKVLIRMMPVTVSCSTLLRRFKNAGGHTLYSFGEELDTLRKTNGAGSWSSKYDIYRLSFDRGEWGQDYNSDQAESGVVRVAYNWTMLGTDGAMRKCFRQDNIENGLSSRVLVSEMPDSSFQKMPKIGRRSEEDEARIQEAVTRLRSCSGFIDTPRLRRAIERWVEEKRVEAAKDIDRVKDVYRKRAAVIGFRCGVIHHLLESDHSGLSPLTPSLVARGSGQGTSAESESDVQSHSAPLHSGRGKGEGLESAATLKFALMMAEYCLTEQIKAFGEALENEFDRASDVCQRYGSNHSVFDQLPPTFAMGDLRALKHGSCGEAALRKIVSRWCLDHWIEKIDTSHWRKQICDM